MNFGHLSQSFKFQAESVAVDADRLARLALYEAAAQQRQLELARKCFTPEQLKMWEDAAGVPAPDAVQLTPSPLVRGLSCPVYLACMLMSSVCVVS